MKIPVALSMVILIYILVRGLSEVAEGAGLISVLGDVV
jgi:hypothetical protein